MKKLRREEEEWQPATWQGPQIDRYVNFFFRVPKFDIGQNVQFNQNW